MRLGRRAYLGQVAAVGTAALAGCALLGSGNDGNGGPSPSGTGDGREGADGGADPTPTATSTSTATTTSTPQSAQFAREPGWLTRLGSGTRSLHNPRSAGPESRPAESWSVDPLLWSGAHSHVRAKDGTVAVVVTGGEGTRRIFAYDGSSGTEEWTHVLEGIRYPTPSPGTLAGDVLVTVHLGLESSDDDHAVALDLATGEQRWRTPPGQIGFFTHGGSLFRTAERQSDPLVLELQQWDTGGERIASVELPEGDTPRYAVFVGDRLLYLRDDRVTCRCVDLSTGNLLWTTRLPAPPSASDGTPPFLCATRETLFALTNTEETVGSNVVAYDVADGTELWRRFPTGGTPGRSGSNSPGTVWRVAVLPEYLHVSHLDGRVEVRERRSGRRVTTVAEGGQDVPGLGLLGSDATNNYYAKSVSGDDSLDSYSLVATTPAGDRIRWEFPLDTSSRIERIVPADDRLYLVLVPRDAEDEQPVRLVALE